jgi:glutaminyl-peptide cyclotransferase
MKKRSATKGVSKNHQRVVLGAAMLVLLFWMYCSTERGAERNRDGGSLSGGRVSTVAATFSETHALEVSVNFLQESLTSGCSQRPLPRSERKSLLAKQLDVFLSHGTRVGGSWSDGYVGVMSQIAAMAACDPHWTVSFDNFSDTTPRGSMNFTNIVATFTNPLRESLAAAQHLVLAAHWDSKLFSDFKFLGACDSAVPVLMILDLVKTVSSIATRGTINELKRLPHRITAMFFDGEEAFKDWKGTDNTYGSRHLAKLWNMTGAAKDIDLFVLLDLIGPAGVTFHNFYPQKTGKFYEKLRITEAGLIRKGSVLSKTIFFPFEPHGVGGHVDDDHKHWELLGVPILHLISVPFPKEWHTVEDDGRHVDFDSVVDILEILKTALF